MFQRESARAILEGLEAQHPGADMELAYSSPFELLVATVLSAQTTDQRVNQVTPALFRHWPDASALAAADPGEVERVIQPTGFFRQKAKTLVRMSGVLVERHAGQVPSRMKDLVELPGVWRKTANVVLGHAFGVPGLAVDRHVLRVSDRLGLATSDDPDEVERQLTSIIPEPKWTVASDTLILHGRRVCKPKPLCDCCQVRALCAFDQVRRRRQASPGPTAPVRHGSALTPRRARTPPAAGRAKPASPRRKSRRR